MKKQLVLGVSLLTLFALLAMITGDGMLYGTVLLMGGVVVVAINKSKSFMLHLSRWAKANPRKAQGLITAILLVLMGMGIMTGYNLKVLEHELSDTTAYVFTALLTAGFTAVPFLPEKSRLTIPKTLDRHRTAYLGIALSTVVLMTFFGNRVEEVFPNASITRAIRTLDQFVFQDYPSGLPTELSDATGGVPPDPLVVKTRPRNSARAVLTAVSVGEEHAVDRSARNKLSRKQLRQANKEKKKAQRKARKELRKELRKAASTGSCIAAVLLIILLIGAVCAGVCLMLGAFGSTTALSVVGGAVIVAGSVLGIIKVAKWCKGSSKTSG